MDRPSKGNPFSRLLKRERKDAGISKVAQTQRAQPIATAQQPASSSNAPATQQVPLRPAKVQNVQSNPSTLTTSKPDDLAVSSEAEAIWHDAFDDIVATDEKLVKHYLRALEAYSTPTGTQPSDAADIQAGLNDRARRQQVLERLVQTGKSRMEAPEKFSRYVGTPANAVLKAKPIVDIVTTIPHAAPAALPWAGVCVGLKVSNGRSGSLLKC